MTDLVERLTSALDKSDPALARAAQALIPEAVAEIKALRESRIAKHLAGQMLEDFKEALAEMNPEALLADGLEEALIGWTMNHHMPQCAVYDYQKCIEILVRRDGMTEEDADEFLSFNTLGAWVGPSGPIYVGKPET
jgi:hypothetical protein